MYCLTRRRKLAAGRYLRHGNCQPLATPFFDIFCLIYVGTLSHTGNYILWYILFDICGNAQPHRQLYSLIYSVWYMWERSATPATIFYDIFCLIYVGTLSHTGYYILWYILFAKCTVWPVGTNSLLGDIFGMGTPSHTGYIPPKQVWLSAQKGKGLEISGTWSRWCFILFFQGCGIRDPDPHYFWKLDPDPHESEKLDPDPHKSKNSVNVEARNRAVEDRGRKKSSPGRSYWPVVAESIHFDEESDPDSH